ncbi:hypothetical protein H9Q69_003199 [Fusarium xylarioides]|nr:hypothetical protein H9Q69_003199 [Fusarium xylarioides]
MEPDIAAYDWYHTNTASHVVLTSDVFQLVKEIGVKFIEPKLVADVEPDYDDDFGIKKVVDPSARRVWLARGPTKTRLEFAGWKFTLEPRRCHNILVKVLKGSEPDRPFPTQIHLLHPPVMLFQSTLGSVMRSKIITSSVIE